MAVETAATHLEDMPVVDVAQLTDYEQMKGKLAIEVVSLEANSDMLSKIPHQEMEDMAVVYRFVLGSDAEGRSSILVTNNLIEKIWVLHRNSFMQMRLQMLLKLDQRKLRV